MTQDQQEDLSGTTLGPYRVESRLGAGGMGVVYRARDTRLERDTALKVLPAAVAGDAERRARFLREAKSAAAVNHANIAAVYDVGETDGRVWLAMELVEGTTLRARLKRGALDAREAVRIARAIAAGVARAHEKGVVHRDLKPENVMVALDGGVKILDFGLAKLREPEATDSALEQQETQTLEGRVMGTPGYMSPEQASGRPVDARSDVYALGVVLHEMLTGGLPGVGTGRTAIAHAGLEAVVARCLAAAPEDRWADAGRLLAALEAVGDVAGPRAKRSPALRWIGAAAIAVLGLAAIVVTSEMQRAAPPASIPAPSAAASPAVTSVVSLPTPSSTVGPALAEYRAGLQLMRDDSWEEAHAHFVRAGELDPSMAEAHLRSALYAQGDASGRTALAKAMALRAQLSERDRVMLDAVEPVMGRSVPDFPEAVRRLESASQRYPADVEFLIVLGTLELGHPERAAEIGRRITALDPLEANGWDLIFNGAFAQGDVDTARSAAERCAASSPRAADCWGHLAEVEGTQGHCEQMEVVARREADLAQGWGGGNLLVAMKALGRPASARRAVFERFLATQPADRRAWEQGIYEADLAIDDGRFDRALDALDGVAKAIAASDALRTEPSYGKAMVRRRLEVALETGDRASARRIAAELLDGYETLDPSGSEWRYTALAGRPLEPQRTRRVEEALGRGVDGARVWVAAWARPASGPEDARAALAAIEHEPRLSMPRWRAGDLERWGPDVVTGHVLVLAGRPEDALVYLKRQVTTCFDRRSGDGFESASAHLDLGRALEATGDAKGACEAYGAVVAQWGRATPRSVSAEAARDAMKRMRCAKVDAGGAR